MATLGGDLLKILAHTVLQTGGNVATQAFAAPILARKQMDIEEQKNILNAIGTATEAEAPAYSERYEKLTGRPLPSYMDNIPTGGLLTPEKEVIPKGTFSILDPRGAQAQGFAPETEAKTVFTKPKLSLDQVLAGMVARGGEGSPLVQGLLNKKLGLGLSPYQEQRLGVDKAKMTQQDKQYQQTQDRLEKQFQSSQEFREIMGQGMMDFRSSMLQMQLQNQRNQMMMFGDKMEAGARAQLEKHWDNVQQILRDPEAMRQGVALEPAMDQYNSALNAVVKQNPALGQYFYPLESIKTSTWGGYGKEKVTGVKQKTIPKATTAPLTFPRRVKAGGEEVIVNSQEEYDTLQRKFSK